MNNQDIDREVCEAIRLGLARTQAELVGHLLRVASVEELPAIDSRTIDNSLRRCKERGLIRFDKAFKVWAYITPELPPIDHLRDTLPPVSRRPTVVPSGESAPAGDSELQSDREQAAQPPHNDDNKDSHMNSSDHSVNDIDSAIARAKSSKKNSTAPSGTKRPRLTAEEKAARTAEREAEQLRRKTERETLRASKRAERDAGRKSPHMSKVDKAASKLPSLNTEAFDLLNEITANYSRDQLAALAAHLNHFNRTKATERALSQKVSTGDEVRITSGDPRFVGMTGTVTKAQRIRCYVEVAAAKKPVYLFTSDVEVIKQAAIAANG